MSAIEKDLLAKFQIGSKKVKQLEIKCAELQYQNADLKLRNQLLRDRPDLPVERLVAYDKIVKERDELAARCEEIMLFVDRVVELTGKMPPHIGNSLGLYACEIEDKSPKQSLLLHDADVVDKAINAVGTELLNMSGHPEDSGFEVVSADDLREYANQLRAQAKEGVK